MRTIILLLPLLCGMHYSLGRPLAKGITEAMPHVAVYKIPKSVKRSHDRLMRKANKVVQ